MSGGHWNYMQHRFDEASSSAGLVPASLTLLGQTVWGEIDGEPIPATHVPERANRA